MIAHVLLFIIVTLGVGAVNLALSEPLDRPFSREFANYAVVVGGGIALFTAVVMILSALFL
jgi:hypothetical protein